MDESKKTIESKLLEILAEAQEDVDNGRVALMQDTFKHIRDKLTVSSQSESQE